MRRVRVKVRGRVQGVFFRASCAERTRALGVSGWVRNSPDGSVEAAFEGDPDAVASMVDWCRQGPSGARVDAIEVHEEQPRGERTFDITR